MRKCLILAALLIARAVPAVPPNTAAAAATEGARRPIVSTLFGRTADADVRIFTLTYLSPAGEEGYPGALTAHVTYRLNDDDSLAIEFSILRPGHIYSQKTVLAFRVTD
jgi:hypothetical protein